MASYEWKIEYLTDYFKSQRGIKSVKIATAYFSEFGLNLLKEFIRNNRLTKGNVTMFLSEEFSETKAADLLRQLTEVATVYIVEKMNLHAKLYLFEKTGGKHDLIHGSANFTKGGFERNLEFVSLHDQSEFDVSKVSIFFDYCKNKSILVNQSIIEYYDEIEEELQELNKLQQRIRKKLKKRIQTDDAFQEDDYDLTDSFFKYEDYETLFKRNERLKSEELTKRRRHIQQKLLLVDRKLREPMRKRDLHVHWHPNYVTTGMEPSPYNHERLSWMGVRYGKTESEVKQLNEGLPSSRRRNNGQRNEHLGFQKHANVQFCLVSNGFEICFFHAVADIAVDRGYVHDILNANKERYILRIVRAIEQLKGKGFVWIIGDAVNEKQIATFHIDDENPEDFIKFYKTYDCEGYESLCVFHVFPDNISLKSALEIARLVRDKTVEILPLYKAMTQRKQYALKTETL